MRLNPIEVSRRIDATTDAWLLSCWRLEKNELFVTLVLVYQTNMWQPCYASCWKKYYFG